MAEGVKTIKRKLKIGALPNASTVAGPDETGTYLLQYGYHGGGGANPFPSHDPHTC